jgi:DNA-binding CsgD family transcriptional regulator
MHFSVREEKTLFCTIGEIIMKKINVVIDDENRYFAAGLRVSIAEYAHLNNKGVCFLTADDTERPDMIFASSRRRAQRWRRASSCGEAPVVTIRDGAANDTPRVLQRKDDLNTLFELLSEMLSGIGRPVARKPQPLTCRERQVVSYLRCGLDQSQTARILGLSVKTVHSHKRSIMSKLMLQRNHEFIYWLLSQEGEYS